MSSVTKEFHPGPHIAFSGLFFFLILCQSEKFLRLSLTFMTMAFRMILGHLFGCRSSILVCLIFPHEEIQVIYFWKGNYTSNIVFFLHLIKCYTILIALLLVMLTEYLI